MKIIPLYDRIVLIPEKAVDKTASGIMLPEMAQEKSQIAEVVSVGEGGSIDGKDSKIQVKIGDKVLYTKFAGTEIKLDGKDYVIVRQTDILAVLN
ncbi:MAG: co-chaperone GroES [Clostridia bacterium]|nr:co-chaperone GroES [Clostridia bacterium]